MSHPRHPPRAGASQESLASLQQLDPMPITDAPAARAPAALAAGSAEKDLPPLPGTTASGSTASSLGLHAGHGAIFYLLRIQRYSSYAFGIFSSVHLVTTSLVPLATRSVPASESYLLLAREIYQTRLSEPLLVALPVLAHVAAGVGLRLVRRQQHLRRYGNGAVKSSPELPPPRRWWQDTQAAARQLVVGWPPLSVISLAGYALAAALAAHVALNRAVPLVVAGDSSDIGLAYIAHGFARHPATAWASYITFLGLAAGHSVWGLARWLNLAQKASWGPRSGSGASGGSIVAVDKQAQKRRRRTWLALQGGVLLAFSAWAAGGLGVVARGGPMPGWLGRVYDGLYEKVWL